MPPTKYIPTNDSSFFHHTFFVLILSHFVLPCVWFWGFIHSIFLYFNLCFLSLNVKVHLYIMLNYNVQALTESIFPEVRSIVRDNRSPNILWHCPLSQIMEQECPFHKSHQLQGDRTLCCCSYHQSSRTLYHLCSCKKNLKKNQTKRNPKTTRWNNSAKT